MIYHEHITAMQIMYESYWSIQYNVANFMQIDIRTKTLLFTLTKYFFMNLFFILYIHCIISFKIIHSIF